MSRSEANHLLLILTAKNRLLVKHLKVIVIEIVIVLPFFQPPLGVMSEVTGGNWEDALWRSIFWRWGSACLSFRLTLWTSMHSFMREAMLENVVLALPRFSQNTTNMVWSSVDNHIFLKFEYRYLGGSFLFITRDSRSKIGAQAPGSHSQMCSVFRFNSALLFTGSNASYRKQSFSSSA